jgi:glycosyltransferase involved in cell wall biosynthesis
MRLLLQSQRFDLVHLHNIYHQLSPSILDAVAEAGLPAVMTLHDYKIVCPTYKLLSEGRVCERCAMGKYWHCLLHRCVKVSYAKSFVNMAEMYLHHYFLGQYGKVALFLAPSKFLADKVGDMGFPGEVRYLPNFIDVKTYAPQFAGQEPSLVFFGRLSPEKGLPTLIQAMADIPGILKLIGEGSERPRLEAMVHRKGLQNVQFLGYRQADLLFDEVKKSWFAVVPSEWYENNPLSILEAFALGKPVVGARIGGIPELVRDGDTGLTFEPGNVQDLQEKIVFLLKNPELVTQMGKRARQFVEEVADPERHYQKLMEIYRKVIENHRNKEN